MRILLATDFSPSSNTAIRLVHGMTMPAGSRVRIVHAVEPITTVTLFAPAALLDISEASERDARAHLAQAAKRLATAALTVDSVVGRGRAADVIVEQADAFEPDLLVMGSRGRGAIATALLGSVCAEVIDRAPCPVLIARRTTLTNVILAEDGSTDAAAGARAFERLLPLRGARVHVVSVTDVRLPMMYDESSAMAGAVEAVREYEAIIPTLRARSTELARERATALHAQRIISTWEQRDGDPAYELIRAATEQRADCIVVGSRGQTGLRRLMLGSVARGVLYHAPCSVLVATSKMSTRLERAEAAGEPALVGPEPRGASPLGTSS